MKKSFAIACALLAAQLPALAAQLPAQKNNISVLDLKWGSSPEEVKKQLLPRFSVATSASHRFDFLAFEGELGGRKVTVLPTFTRSSQKLMSVSIIQFIDGNKLAAEIAQGEWSRILTRKYGKPAVQVRGQNDIKDAVPFASDYGDAWRLRDGTISCYVSTPFLWAVNVDYEQDAMQKVGQVEIDQIFGEHDDAVGKDL